jgi:hypothetical protein
MLNRIKSAVAILTGNTLTLPEVPEVYKPPESLDPRKVANYIEWPFAVLVAQGRARVIEWHVVTTVAGEVEVGFDHDLEVWCSAPGSFHNVEGV